MEKFQSSEIYEMIDKVLHYQLFSVNQTPITISSLIVFVLTIALLAFASRMISRHIVGRAMRRFGIEDTKAYTIRRVVYYLLLIISFIFAFQFIGIDLGGLAVIFGLLSVGIGFGLQNITANFIAGIILLFERPISIGDRVQVGRHLGLCRRSICARRLSGRFRISRSSFRTPSLSPLRWSTGRTAIPKFGSTCRWASATSPIWTRFFGS